MITTASADYSVPRNTTFNVTGNRLDNSPTSSPWRCFYRKRRNSHPCLFTSVVVISFFCKSCCFALIYLLLILFSSSTSRSQFDLCTVWPSASLNHAVDPVCELRLGQLHHGCGCLSCPVLSQVFVVYFSRAGIEGESRREQTSVTSALCFSCSLVFEFSAGCLFDIY